MSETKEKYVLLQKNVGETPLECLEDWRLSRTDLEDAPLAYAGRLDPMASGTLLVLIGEECKKQTEYHHLDKEYEFSILFGVSSDSGDVLGIVSESGKSEIESSEIHSVLKELIGKIELPYPIFSAKTVQGKPLHTWTMEGRLDEITIPTKKSEIFELELLDLKTFTRKAIYNKSSEKIESIPTVTDPKKALGNDFRRPEVRNSWRTYLETGNETDLFSIASVRCICSSGTYMRTLAETIASTLNTKGLAFSIHRSKIGKYNVAENKWHELFK